MRLIHGMTPMKLMPKVHLVLRTRCIMNMICICLGHGKPLPYSSYVGFLLLAESNLDSRIVLNAILTSFQVAAGQIIDFKVKHRKHCTKADRICFWGFSSMLNPIPRSAE